MLSLFLDLVIISLVTLAGLVHILRLIYLIFKPRILKRFNFISNPVPSRTNLVLYYILVIGVCIYAFSFKLNRF